MPRTTARIALLFLILVALTASRRRPVHGGPSPSFPGFANSPAGIGTDVNAADFGAKGDGITDDADAIQAAIDFHSSSRGGRVYLPPGSFLVRKTIRVRRGIRLEGASRRSTYIIGGLGVTTVIAREGSGEQDITIQNLCVKPLDPKATGIDFTGITQSRIEDVAIMTWLPDGSSALQSDGTVGIRLGAPRPISGYSNAIRDVRIENVGVGIWINDGANLQIIDHVDFHSKWGLVIEGPDTAHVVVSNSRFDAMGGGAALLLNAPDSVIFQNSYFERLPVAIAYDRRSNPPTLANNYFDRNLKGREVERIETALAVQLIPSTPNVVYAGTIIEWQAKLIGSEPSSYRYRWSTNRGNGWIVEQDFSPASTFKLVTQPSDRGNLMVAVTVTIDSRPESLSLSTSLPVLVQ